MKKLLLGLLLSLGLLAPALAVTPATQPGNAAYTMTNTDVRVITSAAFTASRTWTLPFAAGTCVGQTCLPGATSLEVSDVACTVTATNTLVIARGSGDTINGAAADLTITIPCARVTLTPTSANNWQAYITYAGQVGSVVSTTVAGASAVSLTSTTAKDIATVALTPGDWSCSAVVTRKLAASTSVTQLKTSISATADTSGSLDTGTAVQWSTAANVMAADSSQVIGPIQISITAAATYHLVAEDTFSVSTNAGYGQIICRRMR